MEDMLVELQFGLVSASTPAGPTTGRNNAARGGRRSNAQLPLLEGGAGDAAASSAHRSDDVADADDPVLQALGWSAATLDVLLLRTGWSVTDLTVQLLTLELDGLVERLPGELFQRIARG
jgi:predicted Rossmann fold nucleotide-binding protein DprA/Smf involved in DNA uptake